MGGAGSRPHYAAIDIGSYTVRLLIARLEGERRLVPVRSERRITRLARQFEVHGDLNETAVRESLEVIDEYGAFLAAHGVESVECGATGVVRKASNGTEFMERVRRRSGLSGSILSESSEAFWSAKGVVSVLPPGVQRFLTFDLGGGTTEFLFADRNREEPLWSTSVFAGASTVTERFLAKNPPGALAIDQARQSIQDALGEVVGRFCSGGVQAEAERGEWDLVGTAGTVTTLAAMKLEMDPYVPFRVNGLILDEGWLRNTIGRLSAMSVSERRGIPGLEAGREDVILGGALIVQEIMLGLGRESLTVTDAGLLEGLLLKCAEEERFGCAGMHTPFVWEI